MMRFDQIIDELKPSDTYRAGDRDFDMARAKFYRDMASVYGFEGWSLPKPQPPAGTVPGRDGRQAQKEKYGNPGIHSYWDPTAGTVEAFERTQNLLDSEIDPPLSEEKRNAAAFEGNTRRRTARKLRDLFEGSQVSSLKSADLEAIGGGGFGPRLASDHALDCMAIVHGLRLAMPPALMTVLETVLVQDRFTWQVDDRAKKKAALQAIRMALDFAAYEIGAEIRGRAEIRQDELIERWPELRAWFQHRVWGGKGGTLGAALHAGRVTSR